MTLESDATVPATLSAEITTGLLREQMNFGGLIVTDSLDMAGVAARYPPIIRCDSTTVRKKSST